MTDKKINESQNLYEYIYSSNMQGHLILSEYLTLTNKVIIS